MGLDNRLKQVALSVAIRHLSKNRQKSKERTCRNVIELAKDLSEEPLTKEALNTYYNQLMEQIDTDNEEELRTWVIQTFHLS
ncbi:hypothetical protein PBV87_01390 [Niameybacter massiliensis]|uniref:Uncharacterized protein n=1 Tax=Holtiella tumoricola TaxID=3018743 RepID=A0AA42DJN2_9FIRM|nr:hypothetical protein [Holtiella tumoricola]MDA3730169.1 hypothetical protein [Holtiella tumoricola]